MRSETFGRLLKAGISSIANCEGKTNPIVEEELGAQIGVAAASIQRYKAGHLPPDPRTVQLLAEACVRRGLLGREWTQRLLHVASYPTPDKLLDQLCPIGPTRPRPPRVYENLPAPTYSQFVMRAKAFADVIDGLQQRSAVVLIASLGGMGKTSLAREVAARCLHEDPEAPRFDAVVWVSDKDRPGTTNLTIVLDEIARTLDYPGFIQYEHEEKRHEVEQLLRRQRVLLVIDNFETITDGALLSWLLRLPEPSKAIVTSREKQRTFWSSWLVELRGMTEDEARMFIDQRLRQLKMEQLVSDPAQLEPLLVATGGNPKAIEVTLGLVKHERRPLQQVVDDLYAARGDLFDDLFTRAWALLDEAARRVLLVMTFYLTSASGESLSATADVAGFALDRAVERLVDLALLDVQQTDLVSLPRYTLHPLVRAFAIGKLADQPAYESSARDRWLAWYLQLAIEVQGWGNNPHLFEHFTPEQETAYAVILWAKQHQRYAETLQLTKAVGYYYFVRGLWDKNLALNLIGAEAARWLDDQEEEAIFLSYHAQRLCMQNNVSEVEKHLPRLRELQHTANLTLETSVLLRRTLVQYYIERQHFAAAQQILEDLEVSEALVRPHTVMVNRVWLGVNSYRQGDLDAAQRRLQEALQDAKQLGYVRVSVSTQNLLAAIALDRGQIESAETLLLESSAKAYEFQSYGEIASIQRLYGRLYAMRGDLLAARAAYAEAINRFERLGAHHSLNEARQELQRIEAGEVPSA